MSNNKQCDVITVYFIRAYDKLCHKILYDNIKTFGFDGCYMRWIINFLSDRLHYVEYDSIKSTATAIPSETIQRWAIGGTLFCMFINDLCNVIRHCHKWLYVDNIKMMGDASKQTACTHVQIDLDAISKLSEENLPINIPKCAALHCRLYTLNCQYNICGQQIIAIEQCMDWHHER